MSGLGPQFYIIDYIFMRVIKQQNFKKVSFGGDFYVRWNWK